MIEKLKKEFVGVGEVKGFKFKQVHESNMYYIYEVNTGESIHYELFEKRNTPVCLDFQNKIFSKDEYKETYPRSNYFGKIAWTQTSLEKAKTKIIELNNNI